MNDRRNQEEEEEERKEDDCWKEDQDGGRGVSYKIRKWQGRIQNEGKKMVMTKEGEEGADNQEVEKKRHDRKMTTGKKMRKMRKRK